jgi:putative membrane protein
MALFDEAAKKRIEAAVAAVEQRTSAEIAVVTVPRSDDYDDLRAVCAAAMALAAASVTHALSPRWPVAALLWLQLAVFIVVWFGSRLRPMLRWLVPLPRAHASVRRAASEAFLRHEVFATRARTGVLIFVSELERCVVILGDSGIHARVSDSGWRAHVDHLVHAIHEGRAAEGTCEVIEALGTVLAADWPTSTSDQNELSDAVRTDDALTGRR